MSRDVLCGLSMMFAAMCICVYLLIVHIKRMRLFSGYKCFANVIDKQSETRKILWFPVTHTKVTVAFLTADKQSIEAPLTYVDEDVASRLTGSEPVEIYYDERSPKDAVAAVGYCGNSDIRATLCILMVALFLLGYGFATMGISETLEFIRKSVRHRPIAL